MTPQDRPRDPLYNAVSHRVQLLQSQYLADVAYAVATLARLRRCEPGDVGADPLVWSETLDWPDDAIGPRYGDEPTAAERAAHASMVLFALHQQSHDQPVHRPGYRWAGPWGSSPGREPTRRNWTPPPSSGSTRCRWLPI